MGVLMTANLPWTQDSLGLHPSPADVLALHSLPLLRLFIISFSSQLSLDYATTGPFDLPT